MAEVKNGGVAPGTDMPGVFSRKASGLVRSASVFDVFNFDMINGMPGIIVILFLLYIPTLYPGASIPLATLITGVLCIPLAVVFARLASVFPRSGGDYVYNSRLLHPSVGFGFNLVLVGSVLVLIGQGGVYTGGYGLGPLLRVAGVYWNNPSLVSAGNWVSTSNRGLFIIGAAGLVLFICIFIFAGMKVYFRVQMFLMAMGTIALLMMLVFSLVLSRATALANIDHVLHGIDAKGLADLAVGKSAPFSLVQTLKCVLWANFGLLGCLYSVFIGGEVKSPARSQIIGILGSLGFMTVELIVVSGGMLHQFGYTFFANLGSADPSTLGISSTPSAVELSAYSMNNGIPAVIMLAFFSVWGMALVGVNTAVAARCMFAWSLDRVVPKWISSVSARWASPYGALLLAMALGIFFALLFSLKIFTPIGTLWGFSLVYHVVFISAIVLPFRNRPLWRASPGHGTLGGVPTIVLWGVLALISQTYFDFVTIWDPNAGISPITNFGKFIVFPAVAAVGVVGYFVARAIQRRRGVDIDLNFSMIPPE